MIYKRDLRYIIVISFECLVKISFSFQLKKILFNINMQIIYKDKNRTMIGYLVKLCERGLHGIRSFLRENTIARHDESPRCIADIVQSVIIVDK